MANPITGQTMVSDKTGDRIRFYVKKTTEPTNTYGSWALSFFYDNASIPLSTYSGNYIPSQSGATCVFDSVNNILFLADGIRSKTYDLLRSSGLDQRIRASPTLEDAAFDAFVEAEVNHSEWPALTVTTSEEDKKMLRVFILMALRMYDIEQVESSHSNADKSKRVLDFYLERNPGLEMMLRSLKAVSPRFRSLNVSDRTKVSDADVAKRTGMGDTLLHLAALFDIPAWIGPLVTRGLDINAANAMGSAPLHFAVELGHVDFIKELFKHGVNPNVVDNIDFSPRRVAIERNRLDLLKLLDANGADKTEFLPSSDPYKPPIPMDYYVSVLISRGRVELKPILEYLKSQNSPSSKNRRRVSRKNRKNIRRTRRH
jgi:ankyrin repeat protein